MSDTKTESVRTMWERAQSLLERRILIAGGALVLALAVGVVTYLRPRHYRATAILAIQESPNAQTGLSQLAAQAGLAAPQASTESPQFYADLLVSVELMKDVVDFRYTISVPRDFSGDLVDYYGVSGADRGEQILAAIESLRRDVTVSVNRLTGVITLRVETVSRELSAQLATRFLSLLNDYNVNRRQSRARAEREFLEARVADARNELSAAEDSLVAFHSTNRLFADSPELTFEAARLQRQVTLLQEIFLGLAQGYENAKIDEVRSTPVINVLQNPARLVEPMARGTVRNTVIGGFVSFVLLSLFVLIRSEIDHARTAGRDDLKSFLAVADRALPKFGRRHSS